MNQFLRGWFKSRYKTEDVPFTQYLSLDQVAMYLGKPTEIIFQELINSTSLHGVMLNDKTYVHPTEVIKRIGDVARKMVKKEIKSTSALLKKSGRK